MQMQMVQQMQQMQPRLVLRQAVPRQPVVLSHAQAAQPWLGQVHQLPAQVKPGRMVPVAPMVKHVVKPVAKPSQWIYAAPLQSTRGHLANPKVGLPCPKPQVVSTHVKPPERKELPLIDGQVPKDQGVEGMHPIDFKKFWEQNHQRMIVIDLRGQDRACGAIPGTKNILAMDLLKEIGKYVKDFEEKQIVAFFCQYSAHRAPTVANFFRKSCPSKQRVLILEGGYRGWEAHDLPIQQMEATLSQKACDQLALKIGQNVSKVK